MKGSGELRGLHRSRFQCLWPESVWNWNPSCFCPVAWENLKDTGVSYYFEIRMRGRQLEFWGGGEERTVRDWSGRTPSFPANQLAFLIWWMSPCRKALQLTAQNHTLVVAKYCRSLKIFQDHYKYLDSEALGGNRKPGKGITLKTNLKFSTSKYPMDKGTILTNSRSSWLQEPCAIQRI